MTITPDTGLVDGQTVTVTATGLAPLSVAGLAQCVEGHGQDGCELENRQVVSTDENGGFTMTMVVHTMLATPIGAIDCRTSTDACVIGASTTFNEVGAVWTSMAFDPAGALQPSPSLIAQPGTGLVDNQQINVVGSGYPLNTGYLVQICAAGGPSRRPAPSRSSPPSCTPALPAASPNPCSCTPASSPAPATSSTVAPCRARVRCASAPTRSRTEPAWLRSPSIRTDRSPHDRRSSSIRPRISPTDRSCTRRSTASVPTAQFRSRSAWSTRYSTASRLASVWPTPRVCSR